MHIEIWWQSMAIFIHTEIMVMYFGKYFNVMFEFKEGTKTQQTEIAFLAENKTHNTVHPTETSVNSIVCWLVEHKVQSTETVKNISLDLIKTRFIGDNDIHFLFFSYIVSNSKRFLWSKVLSETLIAVINDTDASVWKVIRLCLSVIQCLNILK